MKDFTRFENEIRQTYHLPEENPAFVYRLEKKFTEPASIDSPKVSSSFRKGKNWVYIVIVLLLVLGTLFFAIGPSNVLAQIQALFGYVPGVGVVDTSTSFYQLAEPVSDSRGDITITIQSAFISTDQTLINFTMTDLPEEIKALNFGDPECNTPAFLILTDGSDVQSSGYSMNKQPDGTYEHTLRFEHPVTNIFNQASLTFPCLPGTLRGQGPIDWRFDLSFEPAPVDLTTFPVTLNEQPEVKETENSTIEVNPQPNIGEEEPVMPTMIVDGDRHEEMTVLGMVEKPNSYWVTWAHPNKYDDDIQVDGYLYLRPFNPILYDANGIELPSPDHELRVQLWEYEDSLRKQLSNEDQLKYVGSMITFAIPKSGVAFPVYAKLNIFERSFPEKEAYAEIDFDGSQVQNTNEPVEIGQEIQIGSVAFELASIEKSEYGGYSFNFNGANGKVVQCQVKLPAYPSNMSGGVSFNPDDPFNFSQSVIFPSIPGGQLTMRVSQPAVLGDLITLIGTWSPDNE